MQNLSLYQLTQKELELAAALEDGGGELTPELEQLMDELNEQSVVKIDSYHHVLVEIAATKAAAKAEKDRLTARIKVLDNSEKRIKDNLKSSMDALGVQRMNGTDCTAYIRNNPESVECDEDDVLSPYYRKVSQFAANLPSYVKLEIKLDKTALKEAIKAGEPVKANIVRTQSVIIK